MASIDYVRWFGELRSEDVALVGGKNSSLGELYSALASEGVKVPNGFALTATAYRDALDAAGTWDRLGVLLKHLGKDDIGRLAENAAAARALVYAATGTGTLRAEIAKAYERLEEQYGTGVAVAVRSSATAEDLPTASFAGQHDSFLNVRGADDLFEACRRCFASVFTDRAIVYRNDNGFDHLKIGLSVGVMKMVRSDLSASGVAFTLDTETGFRDVIFVTGAYGLGENIVQGRVDPDEFYVHKPTFRDGRRAVLRHSLGRKQQRLIYAAGSGDRSTTNVATSAAERDRYCIDDGDVLKLAGYAIRIEDHYSLRAGHPVPMDIEWAKDGIDGELYIVQARPETVASREQAGDVPHLFAEGQRNDAHYRSCHRRKDRQRTREDRGECTGSGIVPARRSARGGDDQSGLGTGDEESRRHRDQPRRSDLPCRDRRTRARTFRRSSVPEGATGRFRRDGW